MENNGNILIKGSDLTQEQIEMIPFKIKHNPEAIKCHSFWFKDGKPSNDEGYYYPVCKSLKYLPS